MSRHFPTPATTLLTLSDGSTLTVKARLTAGEVREAYARIYRETADGTLRVDPLRIQVAAVTSYLLDWTLVGDEGDPPAPVIKGLSAAELEAVLNNLLDETWREIVAAVTAHETALEAASAAKKKSRGGLSADAPSSPSPSAAAGIPTGLLGLSATTSSS